MPTIAINVAVVGAPIDRVAIPLSRHVCGSSTGGPCEYLLDDVEYDAPAPHLRGFAHITLAQLFVEDSALPKICDTVAAVVERLRQPRPAPVLLLEKLHRGPVFERRDAAEYRLPSIVVGADD